MLDTIWTAKITWDGVSAIESRNDSHRHRAETLDRNPEYYSKRVARLELACEDFQLSLRNPLRTGNPVWPIGSFAEVHKAMGRLEAVFLILYGLVGRVGRDRKKMGMLVRYLSEAVEILEEIGSVWRRG